MRGLCRGLRSDPYLGRSADMRSGLRAHSYVAYTSFWAVTLSLKFAFDYFAIVQPMVQVAATPSLHTTPLHHDYIYSSHAHAHVHAHVHVHVHVSHAHAYVYIVPTHHANEPRVYHAYT